MTYDDRGRWTRTDRPELLSDRLGYPPERGDQDWAAMKTGDDQFGQSLRGTVPGMDDLVVWLRQQLDDDERWALAANQPYPYAKPPAVAPAGGVHWRWVAGEDWHTVTPDPVVDEFVAEPGYSCNLATVEEWPSGRHSMPRTYANEIVEMDSAAAGHIARHDPARVLREVEAKRLQLGLHKECDASCYVVKVLALPYSDRPGYRDEWKP